jgi:hypothetical protein
MTSDKVDVFIDINAMFLKELKGCIGDFFTEQLIGLGNLFIRAVLISNCLHDVLLQLQRHRNYL